MPAGAAEAWRAQRRGPHRLGTRRRARPQPSPTHAAAPPSLGSGSPLTGALPITITSFAKQNGQLVAKFKVDGADEEFVTPAQVLEPPAGTCEILTLVLGPIDINLLGLRIQLFGETPEDPITILIYAQPGPGNLLGNLLCALTGILDPNPTPNLLNQIIRLLNRILALLG